MMLKITTATAVVISFIACDDDFETIGASVIGESGFSSELYTDAEISAINNDLAPVQTNNLPAHLLGVYKDQVFGKQEASILTQVGLSTEKPVFGNNPVLDSVVMTIPYFSREIETESGDVEFELDSIYGNGSFKLTVQETNFFLNQFDPTTNFEKSQKYYSNLDERIRDNFTPNMLFTTDVVKPSASKIVEFPLDSEGVQDTVVKGPGLRVQLDVPFFQERILDMEGTSVLANQSNFRNHLRSLYLDVEDNGTEGSMALLNLNGEEAGITLYYRVQVEDSNDRDNDGDLTELVDSHRSYVLNFGGTKVNTFDQEVPQFEDAENLYLKGGEGSMAIINLFSGPDADGDGVSDELEFLRENNWLINEANLEFFVNRSFMTGLSEPERIYLYDLNNNIVLADYSFDTRGQLNAANSRSNDDHLAPLKKDENGNGIKYKVRLTRHINNVLNNDSTNVRLGLVVSQNINLVTNSAVLNETGGAVSVEKVPAASVISPKGTVIYGPNANDVEKRLKLNIYYTEPKN